MGQEEQLLRKGYAYCSVVLQRGLASLMAGLKPFDSTSAVRLMGSWRDGFVDMVQGQLQRLFLSLLTTFMGVARLRCASTLLPCSSAGPELEYHCVIVSPTLQLEYHPVVPSAFRYDGSDLLRAALRPPASSSSFQVETVGLEVVEVRGI